MDQLRFGRRRTRSESEPVTDVCRGRLWWPLAAIDPEYVKASLHEPLGGLPVEMRFGVTATGHQLEAVMRATSSQPFSNNFRVT
jgi:hypothetical protein